MDGEIKSKRFALPEALRRERGVLCTVGALALAVRLVLFFGWLDSPLRYFHRVPGLDMLSLLRYGQWGDPGIHPVFTLHRTLVALIYHLNGASHSVAALAVIQLLCGTGTAVFTAWSALRLWGSRRAALAAGAVAAFYAPAVMYELSMLQETLLLFAFSASFAGILLAEKLHFRRGSGWIAGVLLGLASIGRPTALLWVAAAVGWSFLVQFRRGRGNWRRVLPVVAAVFAVWIAVGGLNRCFNGGWSPFFNVVEYSATVNRIGAPAGGGDGGGGATAVPDSLGYRLFRIGLNAAGRMPMVFLAHEIPDNLNYYFIREYFPGLKFLIGPGLLIPFALAGLVLVVVTGRFLRRESLIVLAVLTLALPISANWPMGRYRLILLLPFALLAVETVRIALRRPRRWFLPVSAGVLAGAFLVNPVRGTPFWRSSDFVAWALALEQRAGGRVTPESVGVLLEGYRLTGGEAPAMNLLIRLIMLREYAAAQRLIDDALANRVGNASLLHYYAALLRLEQRDPAGAEKELAQCDPGAMEDLTIKYHFLRGEAARLQGRNAEAREHFRRSLASPDPFGFRAEVERALALPGIAGSGADAAGANAEELRRQE